MDNTLSRIFNGLLGLWLIAAIFAGAWAKSNLWSYNNQGFPVEQGPGEKLLRLACTYVGVFIVVALPYLMYEKWYQKSVRGFVMSLMLMTLLTIWMTTAIVETNKLADKYEKYALEHNLELTGNENYDE